MNQLGTIFGFEFTRIIRKPTFWLLTLSFPALFGAIIALSIFSNKASSSADEELRREKFSAIVLDDSRLINPAVMNGFEAKPAAGKDAGIQDVKAGRVDAFFYYPADPTQHPIEVYAKDDGLMKNSKYSAAASALLQASITASVASPEKVQLLQHAPGTTLKTYQDGAQTKGFGRVIVPGFFLILFYAIVVLLGNQMLTSTTEEKENRVIEMILTSVKARTLIIGKFLALSALGLIQVVALLTPVVIGYIGFRTQLHIPNLDLSQLSFEPLPIIVGLLAFLGGYLVFSAMLIAIGAAVPTAKEAGSFFGFAIILMFIPFYAFAAILNSPEQIIVKVFTFFPLSAPITLMIRNAVGNLSLPEALISLGILAVCAVIGLKLAVRAFGQGTLEYNRRLGWRDFLGRRA